MQKKPEKVQLGSTDLAYTCMIQLHCVLPAFLRNLSIASKLRDHNQGFFEKPTHCI